jgi:hypothetical protein
VRKILYIHSDATKNLTKHNIFTANNQLDAYGLLLDILENEVDEGDKAFTDKEIKRFFSEDIADLKGESLSIIDWNGRGCPVEHANKHFKETVFTKK